MGYLGGERLEMWGVRESLLDGQRDGGHVPDTGGELLEEVGVRDVQDLGVEDAAAVVHLHEEREQEAGAGEGAGAGAGAGDL